MAVTGMLLTNGATTVLVIVGGAVFVGTFGALVVTVMSCVVVTGIGGCVVILPFGACGTVGNGGMG